MIRALRRAHLALIGGMGVLSTTGVVLALTNRSVRPTVAEDLVVPPRGPVFASAALPVGSDTLHLELSRSGPDSVLAWLTASQGARWPDAVVYWSSGVPSIPLPDEAQALGTVAAGKGLLVLIPLEATALYLYSVAWDQPLGSWPLPTVIAPETAR